jgi:hypothetical protein
MTNPDRAVTAEGLDVQQLCVFCSADGRCNYGCDYDRIAETCAAMGMPVPDAPVPTAVGLLARAEAAEARLAVALEALKTIKKLKSEPIGETGFSVGPLALLQQAQRIAAQALGRGDGRG